ncbi:MAG: DUF92 domain-containing protein [Candidatus Lokiarchaeota archaeon]|nr:DUF92 domain-containing protein [Candidatus Lokiarchaeota archaeon]
MPPTWFTASLLPWGVIVGISTGVAINGLVMAWARRKDHLTRHAGATAFAMGIGLWMIEPLFFLVLLSFFVSSSMLSKLRAREKAAAQDRVAKGSKRDVNQVLANGLPGTIAAVLYAIASFASLPSWIQVVAAFSSISAFAAPNADTWATEIGLLSRGQPRWILDLRRAVEPGTSGGVSKQGTAAAAAGAVIVAGIGFLLGAAFGITSVIEPGHWLAFAVVSASAFIASVIDSVVGATVQAAFLCPACGKETEKRVHCSRTTMLLRGKGWIDNDAVNLIASAFAGASTFVALFLLHC